MSPFLCLFVCRARPFFRPCPAGLPVDFYGPTGYKAAKCLLKDWTMVKSKRVAFYLEEEWLKALAGLAGTFGVSADEVIRRSLPDVAVSELFFRCKIFLSDLRWDEVSEVGRTAIREHLRAVYMKGLQAHLARFGASLESTSDEVETAKKRALEELRADTAHPLHAQIAKAQDDSIYLGCLYDAWKHARAGTPGYAIAQVDVGSKADGPNVATVWAVLKDNKVV